MGSAAKRPNLMALVFSPKIQTICHYHFYCNVPSAYICSRCFDFEINFIQGHVLVTGVTQKTGVTKKKA